MGEQAGIESTPLAGDVASKNAPFWVGEWPYLAMLAAALGGIAFTDLAPSRAAVYWQILAPVYAVLCVIAQWPRVASGPTRQRLIWTQALHWGVLMLAMWLLFTPYVQNMLNSDAIGLGVLALLALGTVLAGIHAAAWRICLLGVVLALAIPAIAFLEQAALLLLATLTVLGVAGAYLWHKRRA